MHSWLCSNLNWMGNFSGLLWYEAMQKSLWTTMLFFQFSKVSARYAIKQFYLLVFFMFCYEALLSNYDHSYQISKFVSLLCLYQQRKHFIASYFAASPACGCQKGEAESCKCDRFGHIENRVVFSFKWVILDSDVDLNTKCRNFRSSTTVSQMNTTCRHCLR